MKTHLNFLKRLKNSSVPTWLRLQLAFNLGTILIVIGLLWATQVGAAPWSAPLNAPGPSATTINYQGRLADSSSNPLTGTYNMSFAIYDAVSGGNVIWGPENHNAVQVTSGLFNVGLGSLTAGGISTSVWDGDRYLQITINGETLSPRELIRSVPIAGLALTVPDGVITTAKLANGAAISQIMKPTFFTATVTSDVTIPVGSSIIVLEFPVNFPIDGNYLIFTTLISRHDQAGRRVIADLKDENDNLIGYIHTSHATTGTTGTQTASTVAVHYFNAGSHTLRLITYTNATTGENPGYVRGGTSVIAIPFAQ